MKSRLPSSDSGRNAESSHGKRSPLKNGNRQGDYNNAPRCGAKTRKGTACKRAAMRNAKGIHTRCPLHGGKCTGAKTAEGRERIGKANLKHGRFTKAAQEEKRWLRAASDFVKYLGDYKGHASLKALLDLCSTGIEKCLKEGDSQELAKYCQGMLEGMRLMTEPLDRVAPFLGLRPWEPDRIERRWRRALEAGAAGLGCAAYREALARS